MPPPPPPPPPTHTHTHTCRHRAYPHGHQILQRSWHPYHPVEWGDGCGHPPCLIKFRINTALWISKHSSSQRDKLNYKHKPVSVNENECYSMIHGLRFADDWGQEESDETFKCKTWQKLFVVYGHTSRTKHTAYGLSTVVTITIHFSFFLNYDEQSTKYSLQLLN